MVGMVLNVGLAGNCNKRGVVGVLECGWPVRFPGRLAGAMMDQGVHGGDTGVSRGGVPN